MRKINILLIILLPLLLCEGCKKLDEKVYSNYESTNFFKTIDQLQTQSLGMYLPFFRANDWDRYFIAMTTMQSKYTMTTESTLKPASVYGFDNSFVPLATLWGYSYQSINRANTILSNAYRVVGDKDLINNHIAEARFMRAWNYYVLVNLFGEVPLHVTETKSVDDAIMARSPIADIYDLIVKDLQYAVDSLPVIWSTTNEGRATKKAAITLLGKVYLTMAGNPLKKTENYAKAVAVLKDIAENPASYNCALLSNISDVYNVDNKNNKEMVFTIPSSRQGAMSGSTVLSYMFAGPQSLGIMTGLAPCSAGWQVTFSKSLYDLYGANDDRKKNIWAYSYVGEKGTLTYGVSSAYKTAGRGIVLKKYVDIKSTGNTLGACDRIVYRYAETLLLAAEAYAQMNDLPNAVIHLNKVRARVKASIYVAGTDFTTKEELLALIYKERSLELCGEFYEIFDIRRLNTVEDNFMNHYNRGTAVYDPKFSLYPIPLRETSYNTLITENNPGW